MSRRFRGKLFEIIPSIASCNILSVKDEILRLKDTKRLHLDIEDGNFVSNITFGMEMVRAISNFCDMKLDVHLMVTNPMLYIDTLVNCNIKHIAVHYECLDYPLEVINIIKNNGIKVGLALNFKTQSREIQPFVEFIDYVLIMTSEPDSCDQHFQNVMLKKIKSVNSLLTNKQEVWADGGIGVNELPMVLSAGAKKIIMGRAIFSTDDPAKTMRELYKIYSYNF